MRLIDADALYERTAEWEAQALHMVEVTMNDEDKTEWRKWSAVLAERSAFKHDIADAITIEPERKTGRWERLMMYLADLQLTYSPNWGANGCGDEKLYEFVTGLIEELEGWEDGGGA